MDYASILSSGSNAVANILRSWVKQKADTDLAEISYLQIKNISRNDYPGLRVLQAKLELERAQLWVIEQALKEATESL